MTNNVHEKISTEILKINPALSKKTLSKRFFSIFFTDFPDFGSSDPFFAVFQRRSSQTSTCVADSPSAIRRSGDSDSISRKPGSV